MKLQAVTICINYADHLACIAGNRRHFDRWVVVTVPEDAATVAVCAEHGLEVVFSRTLQPDGRDFNAANNKARALNEGLAALDPEGWVVIVDSDVLLPRHFRERVAGLPLKKGCLYGAAGRKICVDRAMFEMLHGCEPWDWFCDRNSQALGYFNLFHLEHPVNRYVERKAGQTGGHDDYFFTTSFPLECRRQLPMTVIHTGPSHTNWAGRMAQSYAGDAVGTEALPEEIAGAGTVAVVGYFPGSRWRDMAGRFGRVLLVDHFQVHAPSGSALVEADRAMLRALWEKEAAGFDNVERLGAHMASTLAGIVDGSLEALYLPGEVTPDWLTTALRHWRPKLRERALVCGDLYGLPHWREATFTVSLLLGPPDGVTAAGFWWKRMALADWQLAPPEVGAGDFSQQDRVVVVNRAKEMLEKLLLTLHTARAQWAGPLAVYHWGEEDPSLTIVCGRLGVRLVNVGAVPEGEGMDEWMAEVAAVQPFRRALILQPGMLAVGPLRPGSMNPVADALRPSSVNPAAGPVLAVRGEWSAVAWVGADAFQGGAEGPAVLVCAGESADWTEAAWEVWSLAEAELAQAMAGGVRMAEDATVVTFVDKQSVGDFQRTSLTWKFPPGTPVLVVLTGLRAEDVWLPGATPETQVVSLSRKQVDDLPWLLGWLARTVRTARAIFLPSGATALPGAELWPGEPWRAVRAVPDYSPAAQEEARLTGNRFVPEPFFGLIARERLAEFARLDTARAATLRTLPLVVQEALTLATEGPWVDLSGKGWRRPATHLYVPSGARVQAAPDTRVVVAQNAAGEWRLAEDTVVISLPERTDRRQRIRAAMQHPHRVEYRFVDGVRVTDAEIDPTEVSGVHLHSFKLVAGAQKFLRGVAGCRRAHLRCLEEAQAAGRRSLLLIEDDMQFVDGWFGRYRAALDELPEGWLQLYLSTSDFRPSAPVSTHLHRLAGAYQTTAILYSEAGIEAALRAVRHAEYEVDAWLGNHLHPFGGCYALRPGITFQKGGVSDIMSFDRGVTP